MRKKIIQIKNRIFSLDPVEDVYRLLQAMIACARSESVSKKGGVSLEDDTRDPSDKLVEDVISWLDGRNSLKNFIQFTLHEKMRATGSFFSYQFFRLRVTQ